MVWKYWICIVFSSFLLAKSLVNPLVTEQWKYFHKQAKVTDWYFIITWRVTVKLFVLRTMHKVCKESPPIGRRHSYKVFNVVPIIPLCFRLRLPHWAPLCSRQPLQPTTSIYAGPSSATCHRVLYWTAPRYSPGDCDGPPRCTMLQQLELPSCNNKNLSLIIALGALRQKKRCSPRHHFSISSPVTQPDPLTSSNLCFVRESVQMWGRTIIGYL